MLDWTIRVESPADELLFEGLPQIQSVLDELGDGAILIGGLATAAWLNQYPTGVPARATRDIDLGIDRKALRLTASRKVIRPLLEAQDFRPGYNGEPFRFAKKIAAGMFVVDLLIARGASRDEPPIVEAGMTGLATPGLAYALLRGPQLLHLSVMRGDESVRCRLRLAKLDAAFVLKAALVCSGSRPRADRRIADTTDAILLAAACLQDQASIAALAEHRRRSDAHAALRWLREEFQTAGSAAPSRVGQYVDQQAEVGTGAEWAVEVARRLLQRIDAR